jgi:hypothetical protein
LSFGQAEIVVVISSLVYEAGPQAYRQARIIMA